MAASIELCISRGIQRTAAYKVHRSLGQKIASGGCGLQFAHECAARFWSSRRHLHSLQVPCNETGPPLVPKRPGNGLLPRYSLSTRTEDRESLVGLAGANNPMSEDQ